MKSIILITCSILLSIGAVQGQEKEKESKEEKLHIKLKEDASPDIYVDGKKFDFNMELLDKNMIESVKVLKGDKAIKEYNAPNGVVLVTTKNAKELELTKVRIRGYKSDDPLIIVDGKVSDKESIKQLSPDNIYNIEVFKDEKALEKYNAPNGAIIIKTKKDNKEKH